MSCNRNKAMTIIELTREYYCQRNQLADTADSLWTKVSADIDKEIGDSKDTLMLRKMLSMRSAPILKSFEAYATLSDSLKRSIDSVELKDKILVSNMATTSFKIDSVEMLKLQYLSEVGTESPKGKEFLKNYDEAYIAPCKSTK